MFGGPSALQYDIYMCFGLFFGYVPSLHELTYERLIASHLLDLFAANHVSAAVAYLREICRSPEKPYGGKGRSHALALWPLQAHLIDVEIGQLYGKPEPLVKELRYNGCLYSSCGRDACYGEVAVLARKRDAMRLYRKQRPVRLY